ncbi:hypothetical protein FRAAL6015 [Frankia alni ACN14a]|uniref:Uncharacterized protein n=1 Tax=Frankia alni (strain DSM 45986 / CECT 9034 / ACN14a) TaxID=326424 RepID=Q0RD34_FRAAA|nr:hypothetical protein FRAAL6015 [Frankia alni ACN14a]
MDGDAGRMSAGRMSTELITTERMSGAANRAVG